MSASADAGDDTAVGELLDREEWHDLDDDEREAILSQRLDDHEDSGAGGSAETSNEGFEPAEMPHAEKLNTMAAIAEMAENETWTETVLGDIEIEYRCITNDRADRYREIQDRITEAEAEVAELTAGADGEIDADALAELDGTDEIEGAIMEFVEEATAEEWLTREWLETEEYPERLVGQLMARVRERINSRGERIEKFQ